MKAAAAAPEQDGPLTFGWLECPHCEKWAQVFGVLRKTPVRCIHCLKSFSAVPGKGESDG